MRDARGLTLIEILIVFVLIGIMVGMAIPRVGSALAKQDVRSAKALVISMHTKAKATAVQRAQRTVLWFNGNDVVLRGRHPVTGVIDTVGNVENVYNRYGAVLTVSRDSLVFDPRGLGTESSSTTIYIKNQSYADSIVVTSIGRILR